MAQFINIFKVELNTGAAPVVSLRQMHYADIKANRVGAMVYLDGEPVTLTGTCAGTAILADGSTVPITGGVVTGNTAYINLPAACYSVEGQIKVFVTLTTNGIVTTLLAAMGTVQLTETDTVIDPGEIIPSVNALITAIETAVESIPADYTNLLASIAPNYSDLTFPIQKGQLTWYSGTLYIAKQNIATAENWTAAHWQAGPVSDALKRAIVYDSAMDLTDAEKTQARINIGAAQAAPTGDGTGEHDGLLIIY